MRDLEPGEVLASRYEILEKAAEGGMSVIYRAVDRNLAGHWAVKQMRPLVARPQDLAEIREQFRAEADLLGRLLHRGIPRIIDYFTHEDTDYLVEEFVEGRTLEEVLAEHGRLGEYEVVRIALELLEILAYLHGHGIIYRDLKPGNVMIDKTGTVKLIDFGIARLYTPGKSADTVIVGTPGYASPEHYGKGQTDERSDLYSLGATMHHLLTDRDPAESPFSFPPPRQVIPGISSGVSDVVMRALALDPDRRFPSAEAMRGALLTSRLQPPRQKEFRYPSSLPLPQSVVEGGNVGTIAGGLFGTALAGPSLLLLFPAWLVTSAAVARLRGAWHARFWIELHEDGLVFHEGDRATMVQWHQVREVRVGRSSGMDRTLFGPVRVHPVRIDVHSEVGDWAFPPGMHGWEDLVHWTAYRCGLRLTHDPSRHGADEVYRR